MFKVQRRISFEQILYEETCLPFSSSTFDLVLSTAGSYIAEKHDQHSTISTEWSISAIVSTQRRNTYAAAAARISCRLAFVNSDNTAEKAKVDTTRIPMQMAYALFVWMSLIRW
jgi:hypothetical protein